jgi:hypothetical protein
MSADLIRAVRAGHDGLRTALLDRLSRPTRT